MKKFIAFIFCMGLMMACGTSKHATTDNSYIADGYGVSSVSKDIAYDKAYHAALSKVSRRHDIRNENEDTRIYGSTNTGRGKNAENLTYAETTKTESHMNTYDVKVRRVRHRKHGNEFECYVVIDVPKDHVE